MKRQAGEVVVHGPDRALPLAPRLKKTLHLQIAPGQTQTGQLAMQHGAIPAHFGRAPLDERRKLFQRPRSLPMLTRLPAT
jgi:hypothetical protein